MSAKNDKHVKQHQRLLESNPAAAHIGTLRQRRDWLNERVKAKQKVKWDVTWDTAERDALSWALRLLTKRGIAL